MRVECFISYSREDRKIAVQLINFLEKEGIATWWDEKISLSTDDYSQDIEDAIGKSQCFLILWTEESVNSKWVRNERTYLDRLEGGNERVVSVAINKPSLPIQYASNQCLNIELDKSSLIGPHELEEILRSVKHRIGIIGKNEHILKPRSWSDPLGCQDLAIESPAPGTNYLLSFRPCGDSGIFLIMRFATTDGWVLESLPGSQEMHQTYKNRPDFEFTHKSKKYIKVRNYIYYIRDPIRPYSIQIGEIRSLRPNAQPGLIEGDMTVRELETLPIQLYWLSLTLAEILTNKDTLEKLAEKIVLYKKDWGIEKYSLVYEAISRNPFSPIKTQKYHCRFCDETFMEKRKLYENHRSTLIANDFPFGPYFHYVVIVNDAIHSWEDIEYQHLLGLNKIAHEFLSIEEYRHGAAGIQYGFNSSVRHLVLGSKTHTSAGASIPHIHKQAWGMAPKSSNLAEQLIEVSEAYSNINMDYQGCYLKALRDADYLIWEDEYVALYVPYGQCSLHELQIMVKRPCGTYMDFHAEEIDSFSKAEFITYCIYNKLGITSFNSVLITKLLGDARAPKFRVIQTFVTREVDIAVSELSTLYVVDKHPRDSRDLIVDVFTKIKEKVCGEF